MPPQWLDILRDPFTILVPVGLLAGTLFAGLLLRRILFRILRSWSEASDSHLGELATETLRGPIVLWSLILGLHFATQSSQIPKRYLHYIPTTLAVLWIASLTIAAARFAGNTVRFYAGRVTGAKAVTSITQKLVQLIVVTLGLVILLRVAFNLSLTPILTTLGVGGLAVALALQDTLSNLFAGFYVSISGLVRLGDYIKLNTGEEGFVTDINWRCTTMRGITNNLVVVPNNKLGQAIFTNYHLPEQRMVVNISISVGYDSDLEQVEKILLDEATRASREIKGMLAEPAPYIRFQPGLGDFALIFQVNYSIEEFPAQYSVQSELRKRIYLRLKSEKISMPYPTQTIIVERTPS